MLGRMVNVELEMLYWHIHVASEYRDKPVRLASFRVNKQQSKFETRALTTYDHTRFPLAVVIAVIIIVLLFPY
jgi:hypothetical protein